ncbi:4416_t:CDS:1, partial [Racocetra persica]
SEEKLTIQINEVFNNKSFKNRINEVFENESFKKQIDKTIANKTNEILKDPLDKINKLIELNEKKKLE